MSSTRFHPAVLPIVRRQLLRVGTAAAVGAGRAGFAADDVTQPLTAQADHCIVLFLNGGPSHLDMWDLKPEAPAEIRGPFKPISTCVPGTQISELLPLSAGIVDKFTILRSHSHKDNAHQTGRHWVLTGYPPSFADGQAKEIGRAHV